LSLQINGLSLGYKYTLDISNKIDVIPHIWFHNVSFIEGTNML